MRRVARVVLVGFMASGKSTVGRRLAALLGWDFIDLDEEIERRAGRTIPEIFAEDGEPAFRELEALLTEEVAAAGGVVLAPGGGWITQPGMLELVAEDALVVWLRVSPEEAVRRAGGADTHRPLLAGDDPLAKASVLLAAREPHYRRADVIVDVDGRDPAEIADEIVSIIENW